MLLVEVGLLTSRLTAGDTARAEAFVQRNRQPSLAEALRDAEAEFDAKVERLGAAAVLAETRPSAHVAAPTVDAGDAGGTDDEPTGAGDEAADVRDAVDAGLRRRGVGGAGPAAGQALATPVKVVAEGGASRGSGSRR